MGGGTRANGAPNGERGAGSSSCSGWDAMAGSRSDTGSWQQYLRITLVARDKGGGPPRRGLEQQQHDRQQHWRQHWRRLQLGVGWKRCCRKNSPAVRWLWPKRLTRRLGRSWVGRVMLELRYMRCLRPSSQDVRL